MTVYVHIYVLGLTYKFYENRKLKTLFFSRVLDFLVLKQEKNLIFPIFWRETETPGNVPL